MEDGCSAPVDRSVVGWCTHGLSAQLLVSWDCKEKKMPWMSAVVYFQQTVTLFAVLVLVLLISAGVV